MTVTVPLPGSLSAWAFWGGFIGLLPIQPNPRRTLRPVVTGYAGRDFRPATPEQADTYTFDLSVLLGGGALAAVTSVTIEMADPSASPVDVAPPAHMLAGPSIGGGGAMVSIRLGNWIADMAIDYRVTVRVKDTEGNRFDSFAKVPVVPRSDPRWLN